MLKKHVCGINVNVFAPDTPYNQWAYPSRARWGSTIGVKGQFSRQHYLSSCQADGVYHKL